jgi:Beta-galactosidase
MRVCRRLVLRVGRPIAGLLLTFLPGVVASAASPIGNERLPVLAWGGPPADQTTAARYQELANAGFTHNFSGFPNAAAMANALDIAQAAGIKQFISIPELAKEREAVVERFKNHPALAGYYLRDEPASGDFATLARAVQRISAIDAQHACYINLFPNYATAAQLGAPTYQAYLDRFVAEVPVTYLSFDHYPVIGDTLRPEWYENLEQVAQAARMANKPFWAFALSVAHGPYPVPTLSQLRLQTFSNLVYGAQAIQYFTYWTSPSDVWNFHEGPIDAAGHRTAVYDRVKQINEEIRGLSPVFLGARILRVGHLGTLPKGTRRYEPQSPVTTIDTGDNGAIVSELEKGKRRFVAIVNRDPRAAMSLIVKLDGSVKMSEMRKDGIVRVVDGREFSSRIAPGDMAVLTWEKGAP